MEEVVLALGLLAAVYGIGDLIGRLAFRLLFPRHGRQYLVVPVNGQPVEYAARRLSAIRRFLPVGNTEPLLLDDGLDEEERALARRVCEELGLAFYSREALLDGLQERETVVQ